MSQPTEIDPYFIANARAVFARASGDPDMSGPLAAWAEKAKRAADEDPSVERSGIIVADDGELIAETFRTTGDLVNATYVVAKDAARHGLTATVLDMAIARLHYLTGKRLVHVTYADVCQGASKFIPTV